MHASNETIQFLAKINEQIWPQCSICQCHKMTVKIKETMVRIKQTDLNDKKSIDSQPISLV